ncbi:hypothetical protein J6590_069503 [Homalodisca vitripennis]|nr:hypothetical protein J6590_069503 [Homalodisca vitripennis]
MGSSLLLKTWLPDVAQLTSHNSRSKINSSQDNAKEKGNRRMDKREEVKHIDGHPSQDNAKEKGNRRMDKREEVKQIDGHLSQDNEKRKQMNGQT